VIPTSSCPEPIRFSIPNTFHAQFAMLRLKKIQNCKEISQLFYPDGGIDETLTPVFGRGCLQGDHRSLRAGTLEPHRLHPCAQASLYGGRVNSDAPVERASLHVDGFHSRRAAACKKQQCMGCGYRLDTSRGSTMAHMRKVAATSSDSAAVACRCTVSDEYP